jgi:hypothetical protein
VREVHHNTDAQTLDYIERALAIVEAVELTDELRPIAFKAALDLLTAKQVQLEPTDFSPVEIAQRIVQGHRLN